MKLTSVILAGGQNKRMDGTPKWELKVGTETMLQRSIRRLKGISEEIIIVSGGSYHFDIVNNNTNVKLIYDRTPYLGPLNGIYTALKDSNGYYHFVIAADMPFFSTDLASFMFKTAVEKQMDLVIPMWKNQPQPLHGIYSKQVLQSIESDLKEKKLGLIKWLIEQKKIYIVEELEVKKFNINGRTFFNMNYPDEYQQATRWINEEGKSE